MTTNQIDKALDIIGNLIQLMDSKPNDVAAKRTYTKRLTNLNRQIKKGK